MRRRGFVRMCASTVATVGANPSLLAARPVSRDFAPAVLTGGDGAPLGAGALEVGRAYVFNYPYVSTPCFVIDLGRAATPEPALGTRDGERYDWPGGVGPGRSIVAFSAICAHRMSHPAKAVSFINYRHETVNFVDSEERDRTRSGVIFCCSERSVYDPARGARVLGGPAPQPLAAVVLEHHRAADTLRAVGTAGGDMFDAFFERFGFRLELEWSPDDYRAPVAGSTAVVSAEDYSRRVMHC